MNTPGILHFSFVVIPEASLIGNTLDLMVFLYFSCRVFLF